MTAGAVARTSTPTTIERTPRMRTLRDTWLIFQRSIVLTIRQPVWIVFGICALPSLSLVARGIFLVVRWFNAR